MDSKVLVLATLCALGASCTVRPTIHVPTFANGGMLRDATPLPQTTYDALAAAWTVGGTGFDLFGRDLVSKAAVSRLSLFGRTSAIYSILEGGCLDGGSRVVFEGHWRYAETTQVGLIRLFSERGDVAAKMCGGTFSVQDLKGVEIGISDNSVIAYWTDRVLQREGLAKSDIKTVAIPNIVQRAQLMAQNQLKASVLPDPLASVAMLQGAKVIADDTKYPELGQSVLVFREPYLRQNTDAMRRFVQAYDKAVNELRTNGAAYRSLLIDKGRVPDQLKESFPIPQFPDPSVTTEAEFNDISAWAVEKGIIKAPVSYAASVDTSFVK